MATYYKDDIECFTPRMIWREVRHGVSPLLWLPIFAYFLICKLIGFRPAANYGSPRPAHLQEIAGETIPLEVSQAFQPLLSNCAAAGFRQIAIFESEHIGTKKGYSVLLLHTNGYSYATIVWFRISRGQLTRTKTTFACHSQRTDGTYLDTGSLAPNELIPELIPPGFILKNLGAGSSSEEVICAHSNRLNTEPRLVPFDATSIRQHLLTKLQAIFDFLVGKRFLVPLKESEVVQLTMDRSDE